MVKIWVHKQFLLTFSLVCLNLMIGKEEFVLL